MNEYLIEVKKGEDVTHVVTIQKDKSISLSAPTPNAYKYATKFKVKDRALTIAKKIPGAVVVPSFGGYVNSSKTCVAPLQSKINGHKPYRTI